MSKKRIVPLVAMLLLLSTLAACTQDHPPVDDPETTEQATGDPSGSDTDTGTTAPDSTDDTTATDVPPENIVRAEIYPVPMEITYAEGNIMYNKLCPDESAGVYTALLERIGFAVAEDGLVLSVTLRDLSADFAYGVDEAYILAVTNEGISIQAQTESGVFYACMTLAQLVREDGTLPVVTVKDAPRNALRGVIEGFYGDPWTHEYRKDLFAFMGQNKMNAYIYAPKADAKHRVQWRVLYTDKELQVMTDLIGTAKENHVKFIYALSPGGDIDLGTGYEKELEKLFAKCEQMYSLGVRDFAIFLDDIPTLDAQGHGKLLTDFQERFVQTHQGVGNLIAITTEYGDPFLTDYTDKIAPLIHKDVVLMWTGPGVIPESITNQSLTKILKKYDRKVLIWWNYPVNDTLANHLYMGPCQNLEDTLYQSITGLTANPMNQGYASMVPLFTTGDYLWNPEAYDKDASLTAACRTLMPDAADALEDFIRMTCSSSINKNTDSVELKVLLDAYKKNNTPETRAALKNFFEQMIRNADVITASENKSMVAEMQEWLEKYRAYGKMGVLYIEMEEAFAAGKQKSELLALLGEYKEIEIAIRQNPRLVSESVLTPFLQSLNRRFGIMLGEIENQAAAPATPYTNCNHHDTYTPDLMTDGDDSTYFWTAGNLQTASGGKDGYFGVDLGSVIDVTSIYVKTGMGGGDVLTAGILEYSEDGKEWTQIYQGICSEEIYYGDQAIRARYVRMRTYDNTSTTWIKVCSFEINAPRSVAGDAPAGVPTWSSSLSTYMTHYPELMADNDPTTYFWSSTGARPGDYIQIDLGGVGAVSHITFKTGVPDHDQDYVRSGELCYSEDGQTWTVLCPITAKETELDVNIRARYIRVRITAEQGNWVTVSEFTAVSEDQVSPLLQLTTNSVARTQLLALTDGFSTTLFAPDGDKTRGDTLQITVGESGKVTLTALKLPKDGVNITVLEADGTEIGTVPLDLITNLQAPVGAVIYLPLGNGLLLAEVAW